MRDMTTPSAEERDAEARAILTGNDKGRVYRADRTGFTLTSGTGTAPVRSLGVRHLDRHGPRAWAGNRDAVVRSVGRRAWCRISSFTSPIRGTSRARTSGAAASGADPVIGHHPTAGRRHALERQVFAALDVADVDGEVASAFPCESSRHGTGGFMEWRSPMAARSVITHPWEDGPGQCAGLGCRPWRAIDPVGDGRLYSGATPSHVDQVHAAPDQAGIRPLPVWLVQHWAASAAGTRRRLAGSVTPLARGRSDNDVSFCLRANRDLLAMSCRCAGRAIGRKSPRLDRHAGGWRGRHC